jgi:sarcosine oxidase/L-pipecolate oxidase
MAASRANTKVIVVGGGGTIGSSTALHLLRTGYTPSKIPSAQSAGNDLNKIMGVRLRNKVDIQLSLEARDMWKNDDLFKAFFHNTGRVCPLYGLIRMMRSDSQQLDCASTEEELEALSEQYQTLLNAGVGLEKTTEWLDTEEQILEKAPKLDRERIKGWKAIWSQDGGWLAAAKAIRAIGLYLKEEGVNFGFGGAGSFKKPLFAEDGVTCIGVETVDGTKYYADKVVLAAGAWSSVLVDLEDQCVSKVSRAIQHPDFDTNSNYRPGYML